MRRILVVVMLAAIATFLSRASEEYDFCTEECLDDGELCVERACSADDADPRCAQTCLDAQRSCDASCTADALVPDSFEGLLEQLGFAGDDDDADESEDDDDAYSGDGGRGAEEDADTGEDEGPDHEDV